MPGPNSAPNGDTTIIRGHVNEEFIEVKHTTQIGSDKFHWSEWVPKREWLAERGRLTTGKTR